MSSTPHRWRGRARGRSDAGRSRGCPCELAGNALMSYHVTPCIDAIGNAWSLGSRLGASCWPPRRSSSPWASVRQSNGRPSLLSCRWCSAPVRRSTPGVARRARVPDAEAALADTRDDLTRGAARRAAAEADADALRAAAAQHDAREQQLREETGRQVQAVREQAEKQAERQRAEVAGLERALRRAEQALDHQRELTRRLMQARRAEREWNRELRAQLQRLYDAHRTRPRDEDSDVRALVLQAAIKLVEAPKGMLLSRKVRRRRRRPRRRRVIRVRPRPSRRAR